MGSFEEIIKSNGITFLTLKQCVSGLRRELKDEETFNLLIRVIDSKNQTIRKKQESIDHISGKIKHPESLDG